jgi:hypothetical protein
MFRTDSARTVGATAANMKIAAAHKHRTRFNSIAGMWLTFWRFPIELAAPFAL